MTAKPKAQPKIQNRGELEDGDIATFSFNGHEFTGEVWSDEKGRWIGSVYIEFGTDGNRFVSAHRPRKLPTEVGSVVEFEYEGETMRAMKFDEGTGAWTSDHWATSVEIGKSRWYEPKDLLELMKCTWRVVA